MLVHLCSSAALGTSVKFQVQVKNYYKSIAENKDVSKYAMMMSSATSTLKGDILEALQCYSDYSFLWEQDREEAVMVRLLVDVL